MSKKINEVILANFILNEKFMRKILPFFKEDYFTEQSDKIIFNEIESFVENYNALPSKEAIVIAIQGNIKLSKEFTTQAISIVETIDEDYQKPNFEWLSSSAEKFCKDAAIVNALMESVRIIDGDDTNTSKDGIPKILADALAVSFNTDIGHDYFKDASDWYDHYSKVEDRLEFDIDILNKITRGGLPGKTLTMFLGGTGAGKSNILCHLASSYLKNGKNALYISLELSEEQVSERIHANMINVNINDLSKIGKDSFTSKISKLREKTQGNLIIKEYPMRSAHAGHFKALIDELKIKKNFIPDVVLIDYLGICASSRYRDGGRGVNTNTYFQSVAEELRGMGQYYNIPIISAIQTNRSGSTNSDLDMTDSADSFGVAMTADLFLGVVSNDELASLNQLMFFVLKNRFNDLNYYKKFLTGVERAKMRLYNLEESVNTNIKDIPEPYVDENMFEKKSNKRDFSSFK